MPLVSILSRQTFTFGAKLQTTIFSSANTSKGHYSNTDIVSLLTEVDATLKEKEIAPFALWEQNLSHKRALQANSFHSYPPTWFM